MHKWPEKIYRDVCKQNNAQVNPTMTENFRAWGLTGSENRNVALSDVHYLCYAQMYFRHPTAISRETSFMSCVCSDKYISYIPIALLFTLSGLSPTCTTMPITTAISMSISSGSVSNPVGVAYSHGSVPYHYLWPLMRVRASTKFLQDQDQPTQQWTKAILCPSKAR